MSCQHDPNGATSTVSCTAKIADTGVQTRCNEALQQNEVTNIFEDDFAFLGDDDSGTGNRKENTISEYQSFTDLQHSKGKAVSAIHWLPHRKVSMPTASQTTTIFVRHT